MQCIETFSKSSPRFEQIIGFVSVEDSAESIQGVPYVGVVANLGTVLEDGDVEKMIIALDHAEYAHINVFMSSLDRFGVEFELVPFYNDILPWRPYADYVGGIKLVNLRSMPLTNPLYFATKRLSNIVASGAIIILFSWLYVILVIGVKASSLGPIFFKQRRIGKSNKPFDMLKFRSMRVNGESDTAWSTYNDPRKTCFGSFIWMFSLDEFPQFFNVLLDDMSIVGPRPEIPHYMLRHQIRPGITG